MSTATPGFSTDNNVLFDVGKEVGRVPGSQRHGLVLLNLKKHIINLKAQDHGGRRRTCLGMTPPDVNKFRAELIESIEGLADIEDGSPINLAVDANSFGSASEDSCCLKRIWPKSTRLLGWHDVHRRVRHNVQSRPLASAVRSPITLFIQCCVSLVSFRFFIVPAVIKPASARNLQSRRLGFPDGDLSSRPRY